MPLSRATAIAAGSITLAMLATGSVDASKIVDGSVAEAELAANAVAHTKLKAIAPAVANGVPAFGVPFYILVQFDALAAGTADDVVVFNANAPFKFRVADAAVHTTTAITTTTANLRTAINNGGSLIAGTSTATAVLNRTTTAMSANGVVQVNGTLVIRRSDRGVAGIMVITCFMEP